MYFGYNCSKTVQLYFDLMFAFPLAGKTNFTAESDYSGKTAELTGKPLGIIFLPKLGFSFWY